MVIDNKTISNMISCSLNKLMVVEGSLGNELCRRLIRACSKTLLIQLKGDTREHFSGSDYIANIQIMHKFSLSKNLQKLSMV